MSRAGARDRGRRLAAATLGVALAVHLVSALPAEGSLKGAISGRVASARRVASRLGVHVVELGSGAEVYRWNADTPRVLASNTKLFSSAAALDQLGPGFQFETPVLLQGAVEGGVLHGPLAVVGSGDPNISGRDHLGDPLAVLRRWARELRAIGVRRVAGEVLLVDGLFPGPVVHPDWPTDQLTKWYEAPVSALSLSDGCVLVRIIPGSRPGRPAAVELTPNLPFFTVVNTASTASAARNHWVAVTRDRGAPVIRVRGTIYRNASPTEVWITVPDPVAYFGAALVEAFAREGVEVSGEPRSVDALPEGSWRRVAVHRSDLLSTLAVVNKRSQNFYAESVLRTLGALRCGAGSWEEGLRAVEELIVAAGIGDRGLVLADGSGMSRRNRASPRQVTSLLSYMFSHPWGKLFLESLPFSGEEGLSWERRLAEPPYAGNVFAKTGTLSGVSTLSGYAKARSGRVYAFSILCSGVGSNWQARRAQDGIVRAIIDAG